MSCLKPTLRFTLTEAQGIVPSGKVNIATTNVVNVFNYAEAQVVDDNLIPEKILESTNILGVIGTVPSEDTIFTELNTTTYGGT